MAQELTSLVHGEDAVEVAERVTQVLKPGSEAKLDPEVFIALGDEMPKVIAKRKDIENARLVNVIADLKIASSRGEVTRMIKDGGVYLNNNRIHENDFEIKASDLIGERFMLVSLGKKKRFVIEVKPLVAE